MSLAGALVKRALTAAMPRQVLYRGSPRSPRLALTFDDGPHPEQTPRILEALAHARMQATFFLQGSQAALHPALVREIHAQGHQVANHAASHRKPSELGTQAYVQEVTDTQSLLCDIVGAELPRSFRPPYGATSLSTFARLAKAGFRYVFWSRDSRDSWLKEPQALLDAFGEQPALPGDIVLFHDDYAQTAAALPALLRRWHAAGLQAVRVDALA